MTIGTRIMLEDRKPLIDLLPLEAPLVLFIDPCDACNSKCSFCPTSNKHLMKQYHRPLKAMPMDMFTNIIDGLSKFETKIKVLRMYSHGEPLVNNHFCDMVKYAKQSDKIEMVDTTTNGLLLTPKLNRKLIDSGIDRINISVNGVNAEQYLKFSGVHLDFQNFVDNIKNLYDNRKDTYLFIKINGDTISEEDEKKFLEIFEPIADSVAIEKAFNCWSDFKAEGFVKSDDNIGIYGQTVEKEVDVCPYIFYQIAIQSDGEVSLCFLDWSRRMIIGDTKQNSLYNIWNSNLLKAIRITMLKGERKSIPSCKNCNQLIGGMPEDLDKFKEELIIKYTGEINE